MGIGRRSALVAAVAVALIPAGCGGSDEQSFGKTETSTTSTPSGPEPTQPLSEQLPIFERAVADPNCEDAIEVIHPVALRVPADPSNPRNCDDAVYLARIERGVRVTDSGEVGTGALVDTILEVRPESLIWALDDSGRFKWTGAFMARAQVGSQPDPQLNFARPAEEFVEALRDEDCQAAFATLAQSSRLGQDGEQAFCGSFEPSFMAAPAGLGSRLQKDPDAEPALIGTTQDVAFYALATEPAGYRTLIVGNSSPGKAPVVIDVVPVAR